VFFCKEVAFLPRKSLTFAGKYVLIIVLLSGGKVNHYSVFRFKAAEAFFCWPEIFLFGYFASIIILETAA